MCWHFFRSACDVARLRPLLKLSNLHFLCVFFLLNPRICGSNFFLRLANKTRVSFRSMRPILSRNCKIFTLS